MDDQHRRERMRLPKEVRLGQGIRVYTQLVSQEKLTSIYHGKKLTEADRTVCGCWDIETLTIYVSDALTPRQRWRTFYHELQHAINDVGLCAEGGI